MKSRSALIACALLTGFLIGTWFGQSLPSSHRQPAARTTIRPFDSDGWQLSAGHQTGPAAVLPQASQPDESLTAIARAQSDAEEPLETTASSNDSDIAYFPEVIVGAAGETITDTLVPAPPRPDNGSPDRKSLPATDDTDVWKAELSNLPPAQAEEIIRLREQLGSVASESLGMTFPGTNNETSAAPGLFPLLAETEARPIPVPDPELKQTTVAQTQAATSSPLATELMELAEQHYAENIANTGTPGYRRRQIVLLNAVPLGNSGKSEQAVHAGSSTITDAEDSVAPHESVPAPWISRLDLRQGELISTSNPLDLAIDGPGWLQVNRDGKPEYVRGGVLGFSKDWQLGVRTGAGLLLIQPAIHLGKDGRRIVISESGEAFSVSLNGEHQPIGQLMSHQFLNAAALRRTKAGTYTETMESGGAMPSNSSVRFLQSFLEDSNVDPDQERKELSHLRHVAGQISQASTNHASP